MPRTTKPRIRPATKVQPRLVAIDTETTGLEVVHGRCKPFSIYGYDTNGEHKSITLPVDPLTREVDCTSIAARYLISRMANWVAGSPIIFHNAKFDIQALNSIKFGWWSRNQDSQVPCPRFFHDTLILSHICCSSDPRSLKELSAKYLSPDHNQPQAAKERLQKAVTKARHIGKKLGYTLAEDVAADYWLPKHLNNVVGLDLTPETRALFQTVTDEYGFSDVRATLALYQMYDAIIGNDPKADQLLACYRRELTLLPVILAMEHNGVSIVPGNLNPMLSDFSQVVTTCTKTLAKLAGNKNFNPNSNPQIQTVLKSCGIDRGSADKNIIKEVVTTLPPTSKAHKFATALSQYREASTGVKYLHQYQESHDPNTLRIYTSLFQNGTDTTRLACRNPNLQNVAKRNKNLPLRKAFGPKRGRVWFCFDYHQLQVRIFANKAKDQAVLAALDSGADFHQLVADKLSIERDNAKAITFGIIFGMGATKLDKTTGTSGLLQHFRSLFPGLSSFMASAQQDVKRQGYVETTYGYRLYPSGGAAHKAVNYIVQGDEGDIVKNAMINVHEYLSGLHPDPGSNYSEYALPQWRSPAVSPPFLALQVHDELVIDAPDFWDCGDKPHNHVLRIKSIMESAGYKLGMNTPVEASIVRDHWANPIKLQANPE